MAGFEPAISCSRSRRIEPGFPTSRTKCPAGVEPALPPWQGDRLPLHHGHSLAKPNCQGIGEHRVGLEPTSPHYGCGVLATRRPVLITGVGPEGLEPSPAWLRARGSAARALVPKRNRPYRRRVGPEGVEPSSFGYQPSALPLSYGPFYGHLHIGGRWGSRTPRRSLIRRALCR
jgi:hypothetical protein